jgi:glycosyltransferase involved in cell wall biosynthesis
MASKWIMRVALNIEQLLQRPPGGIGRYAAEIARLLPASAPHEVDVTLFVARHSRRDVESAFASFGLTSDAVVLPVPRRILYELWNAYGIAGPTQLARSLRDVDVVHATSLAVPPRAGVPLVVTVHDAASILFPDAFSRNGRRFHRQGFAATSARADAVIAPTGAAADEISAHTSIARDRITVIHHGVEHDIASDRSVATTRESLGIGEDPYVLWVGTFEPRKNVPVVIDAFARVVEAGLPHRLVLVRQGDWLDADERIRSAGERIGSRMVITGPVAADRLGALYRGADLFVLPSIHEGFGLPVLEAMAQGTGVLCSDLPVLHEVAGDGARYVAPRDIDAWGAALIALLGDASARDALGAAGRARAATFTWERSVAQHLDVYRSVAR